MKKWMSITLVSILAAAMLSACGSDKNEGNNAGGAAGEEKVLIMGTSADYPPYEDIDVATNEIVGFDVDIANYIGDKLGYKIEVQNLDFDGLLAAMSSDKVDFVMAGMTPTPERKKNAEFTDIYFDAKNTIVTKKGSGFKSLEELAGKKVGVQLGSIQESAATDAGNLEVVPLGKIPEIIQEIKSGRLDAAIIEDTVATGYVAANDDLEFNTIPNEGESGSAIAFPKDSKLVKDFNDVLKEMKDSGKMDELVKKWFEKK
ncbi:transporter substrate-binding domain-containing protein [Paenibacillus swuensis]|nr:transporter substrate-binding domain-containing protein [Paenibacillus swuensis]